MEQVGRGLGGKWLPDRKWVKHENGKIENKKNKTLFFWLNDEEKKKGERKIMKKEKRKKEMGKGVHRGEGGKKGKKDEWMNE